MNNTSDIIQVEDIENSKTKKLQIEFEDFIDGIKSDNPIKASLNATSLGEFIQIKGIVTGSATLECDLCLEKFDYKFDFEMDELFAKNALIDEYGLETELKEGQFVTDLEGNDSIDIRDLLYQSVILNFPNKKVCGINCKGGDIFIRDENISQMEPDPRMAVFKSITVNSEQ